MHYSPTADPILPVRLPSPLVTKVLPLLPEGGPASEFLRSLVPHPARTRGAITMVGRFPRSTFAAALDELDLAVDDLLGTNTPGAWRLQGIASVCAVAVGRPVASVRQRLLERHSSNAGAGGGRLGWLSWTRASEISTQHAMALRLLEDAEVLPGVWHTTAGALTRGGLTKRAQHETLPGHALVIPPMPVHLLPPPMSLGGGYSHLLDALRSIENLPRLEIVATQFGGPAAAARAWLLDFLGRCLTGPDPCLALASEARRLTAAAWEEVVTPAAVELHRVQKDTTRD